VAAEAAVASDRLLAQEESALAVVEREKALLGSTTGVLRLEVLLEEDVVADLLVEGGPRRAASPRS